MKYRSVLLLLLALIFPGAAGAHLGSPDIFYDGPAGPYLISVTIRMPAVVPGRAQILARIRGDEPVSVAFAPISHATAVSNTPPAEAGTAVAGETNSFTGELWLMTRGAYSIDVRINGKPGAGSVQIPVNSVALHQLPLPAWLGGVLLALGLLLFGGAVAIVGAAAGEAVLPPGVSVAPNTRRRYWTAVVTTTFVLTLSLYGGKKWWNSDEAEFRDHLRDGGWPRLEAEVETRGPQRILHLQLGNSEWKDNPDLALAPDHGKLLHLYLVRQPNQEVFAHIHPVRHGRYQNSFLVALPPLPEGDYEMYCDLTLAASGTSSTATNIIHIPAAPGRTAGARPVGTDPDDSWLAEMEAVRDQANRDTICELPGGVRMVWKAHSPLHAQEDAGLRFEVRDDQGKPVALEPYMEMMAHAAVIRSTGDVFAHLHPSGNFSMAAQTFFDAKMAREAGANSQPHAGGADVVCSADASHGVSSIFLPYEFPGAGNYRIWVQIKTGGQVRTAVFDTTVQPGSL